MTIQLFEMKNSIFSFKNSLWSWNAAFWDWNQRLKLKKCAFDAFGAKAERWFWNQRLKLKKVRFCAKRSQKRVFLRQKRATTVCFYAESVKKVFFPQKASNNSMFYAASPKKRSMMVHLADPTYIHLHCTSKVCHLTTRICVILLGLCFKTGWLKPFVSAS